MAQPDIAGLLTGVGSAPIDPMQGASIRDREIALQQQGLAGLRQGIGALTGGRVDARNPLEKAKAALAGLDPNKKEDRAKILQIVSKVSPERVPALREAFAKKDEEARKQGLIETQNARGMQIKEQSLAEQVRGNVVGEENQRITRERQAKNDAATASDRDRRFTLQEDTLKLSQDKAAADQKLVEDTAASNLVLRQSYLDIAVADGNSKLAKLIASGMPLEKIQDELFKGSDAVVKALTSDERDSFDTLMESPVFEALAETIKEPSNYFSYVGNFSDELETVIYQRAKQLKQASGMSDAQALKRALEETATNFPTTGGGGGGGGDSGRKNRRLGGNVPPPVDGSTDMFSGTAGTKEVK